MDTETASDWRHTPGHNRAEILGLGCSFLPLAHTSVRVLIPAETCSPMFELPASSVAFSSFFSAASSHDIDIMWLTLPEGK